MPRKAAAQAAAAPSPVPAPPVASAAPPGTNGLIIRDKAVIAAAAEYAKLQAVRKQAEARLKVLNVVLKAAMGTSATAYAGPHVLSLAEVPAIPPVPNRLITRDMIGQVIPGSNGRAAYTQLVVR